MTEFCSGQSAIAAHQALRSTLETMDNAVCRQLQWHTNS